MSDEKIVGVHVFRRLSNVVVRNMKFLNGVGNPSILFLAKKADD